MADLRTMEDLIRQRLTVDRRKGLSITRTPSGHWQAQTDNPDGSFTVHVGDDPADVLWNVLTPHQMHRRAPSGRVMALADGAADAGFGIVDEGPVVAQELADEPTVILGDDLAALLG